MRAVAPDARGRWPQLRSLGSASPPAPEVSVEPAPADSAPPPEVRWTPTFAGSSDLAVSVDRTRAPRERTPRSRRAARNTSSVSNEPRASAASSNVCCVEPRGRWQGRLRRPGRERRAPRRATGTIPAASVAKLAQRSPRGGLLSPHVGLSRANNGTPTIPARSSRSSTTDESVRSTTITRICGHSAPATARSRTRSTSSPPRPHGPRETLAVRRAPPRVVGLRRLPPQGHDYNHHRRRRRSRRDGGDPAVDGTGRGAFRRRRHAARSDEGRRPRRRLRPRGVERHARRAPADRHARRRRSPPPRRRRRDGRLRRAPDRSRARDGVGIRDGAVRQASPPMRPRFNGPAKAWTRAGSPPPPEFQPPYGELGDTSHLPENYEWKARN